MARTNEDLPVRQAPAPDSVVPEPLPDVEPEVASPTESGPEGEPPEDSPRRSSGKIIAWVLLALILAAAAVIGANAFASSSSGISLPATDPAEVVGALSDAGFDCRASGASGDVATCGSTIAVRVFPDEKVAQAWVVDALTDPLVSSAVGWVGRGNVVVVAPVAQTPAVAEALGEGARKY